MDSYIYKWFNRPNEVKTLLNPAYCGLIILLMLKNYKKISKNDINITLLFLALPIIMNSNYREIIKKNKTKNLVYITSKYNNYFYNFEYYFNYYIQYTFEGLFFYQKIIL